MDKKNQNRFGIGEMMLGFLVGLFLDIIAFIIDIFSVGAGGLLIQGTVWPFIKKFWISSKNSKQADILKDYLLPIIVQALPIIPTMCATIPVYMYIENKLGKSGIINTVAKVEVGTTTKTTTIVGSIQKIERGAPLSNSSKPRIKSLPTSPVRTQNNPIIQEHNEEEYKNAA